MASTTIESLPFEVIDLIISYVPIIDYNSVKLAGSHYITSVIRQRNSRTTHQQYNILLRQQDQASRKLRDGKARTALEINIQRGNEFIVRRYIDRYGGAKIQAPCREGRAFTSAFHMAALYGATNILQLLMDRINLRCRKTGSTALHMAAKGGHLEATRLLVENGADIDALDFDERTPLKLAKLSGCEEVTQYLLEQGGSESLQEVLRRNPSRKFADLVWRCTDQSALIADLSHGFEFEQLPLRRGALRVFAKYLDTKQSRSPELNEQYQRRLIVFAIAKGVAEVVEALIDDGFGVNSWLQEGDRTPLHVAALAENSSLITMLLGKGADPKYRSQGGMAPLHVAISRGYVSNLMAFLSSGVSVNLTDGRGRTALHCPGGCYDDFVHTLVDKYGADIEAKDIDGQTPLHYSVIKMQDGICQDLLDRGADVNAQDRKLETPLMHACRGYHASSINLLMQHGADITLLNTDGLNAMEVSHEIFGLQTILHYSNNPQLKAKMATLELIRQTRIDDIDEKNLFI